MLAAAYPFSQKRWRADSMRRALVSDWRGIKNLLRFSLYWVLLE